MAFWLIAMALAALVTAYVLWPLLRDRQTGETGSERFDLQIYRDQLTGIEQDLERGILNPDEAERTRTEVSRRLLEADKASQTAATQTTATRPLSLLSTGVLAALLLAGSAGVYAWIGAGGAPDLPLEKRRDQLAENQANRPAQAEMEARVGDLAELADQAEDSYKALVEQLRQTAKGRPDDLRGQELLAQHEARLGYFAAARIAMGRTIDLKGDAATAEDYTNHAELMIIAAGGYVSPMAEKSLSAALRSDPTLPRARYYSGLDLAQNGRPDLAYRLWTGLLQEGPEDAPWIAPIREQIGDVARMAGISPGPLPGPTSEQVEDAANLSGEDQQQMIRDMVSRLSERLATEGGSAPEWARLIRAYGVLGETERAAAIWAEAKTTFSADAASLAEVTAAAKDAGVAD